MRYRRSTRDVCETVRSNWKALTTVVLATAFLPVSLSLGLWIASSASPAPAAVALAAAAGLLTAVAGSVLALWPQLNSSAIADANHRQGLLLRSSDSLAAVSRELAAAAAEDDWTSRVRASLRNSAGRLEILGKDLASSSERMVAGEIDGHIKRAIYGLSGFGLAWLGMLMQGAAAWWAVS